MGKQRYLAISPTPECLCLAALCSDSWDSLEPAGAKLITRVLEAWNKNHRRINEALILLPRVDDPNAVRPLLEELAHKGVAIRWFAPDPSPSVSRACEGLPSVTLIQGADLYDALDNGLPGAKRSRLHLDALQGGNTDLIDFLRYKISLFLMRQLDPEPLRQAVDFLMAAADKKFRMADLKKEDQRALEDFRDAEFPFLEGRSRAIVALKERILKVAPSEMSTLILGKTGTGKEAVAYYLHEFSPRRARPFIVLNCAGLEENFLRSELFGHVKGAFTGALTERSGLVMRADGGTLFLDEVGEMSLPIQADLLRFLQTRRFRRLGGATEQSTDIRLIAATQPDLREKIKEGAFREDLYFRIAEVEIETPALADVPEDVFRVARHYIYRLATGGGEAFDVEAVLGYFAGHREVLENYAWPGNVRELVALVKRRIWLGDDVVSGLGVGVSGKRKTRAAGKVFDPGCFTAEGLLPVDEVVGEYVRMAFENVGGVTQKELAFRLGKSLNTVKKILRG